MTPKFSIITCTYNAGHTLERTLRSVREQTYTNYEIIVVDGASQDGTLEIARKYEPDKLISEPDRGLYDAMNKGIKAATGDYLIFLNAGDKFHSADTLQQAAATLDGTEDVIYGQTALVDNDGQFIGMRHHTAPERLDWQSFKDGMLVCHQAFWARRGIAAATPYDLKYRYSADVDWCIRVMKQSKVLKYTGLTLIDYLSEGMTTTNRTASLKERFHIMRTHYGLPTTIGRHLLFVLRTLTDYRHRI